jgi:hypothetical protein
VDPVARILRLAHARLDPDETARLVSWLAWRTGRPQVLAGSGPADERLVRALGWLSAERAARLADWLEARDRLGAPLVPRGGPRDA